MKTLEKWTPDFCCTKQNVSKFHEQNRVLYSEETPLYINAICLSCNTHWSRHYGHEVEKFTSKQWDAHINFLYENPLILEHLHSVKSGQFRSDVERFIGMSNDDLNYWNMYFAEGFGGVESVRGGV